MTKKIISIFLTIATIMSTMVVLAFAIQVIEPITPQATQPHEVYGYTYTTTITMGNISKDMYLGSVKKCYTDKTYSKIRLRTDGSSVAKMKVWLTTSNGTVMSEKYLVYPNDQATPIFYNNGQTFSKNAEIRFIGEQANIAKQTAHYTLYSY